MAAPLSIVLGPHGQVEDLRNGAVKLEGADLDFIHVKRMPDAYRDMARTQPYQISEMAPVAYLMAVAAGAPLTALPLPMTRRFRHNGLLVREDAGIKTPADLAGRPVGVRAFGVTAAIWTRGVLQEEYGLNPNSVTWLTEEEENVPGFTPPANVRRVPNGQSLSALFRQGALDAGFAGLAGLGDVPEGGLRDIVSATPEQEVAWFRKTGIYPLHGFIVLRNDVLSARPGLPLALFGAFSQAKRNYLARIESGAATGAEDRRYASLAKQVGDPLPYGLEENQASFDALLRYAHAQGLIPPPPSAARLFPDPRRGAMLPAQWS